MAHAKRHGHDHMTTIQKRKNAGATISYGAMFRRHGFAHVSDTFTSKTRAEAPNLLTRYHRPKTKNLACELA
jgi:hypothetical protein